MTTIRTRIGEVPVTFTRLSAGHYFGEFLSEFEVLARPYEFRSTYEGSLPCIARAMENDVEMASNYACCVACDYFDSGAVFEFGGVSQWLCHLCGAKGIQNLLEAEREARPRHVGFCTTCGDEQQVVLGAEHEGACTKDCICLYCDDELEAEREDY